MFCSVLILIWSLNSYTDAQVPENYSFPTGYEGTGGEISTMSPYEGSGGENESAATAFFCSEGGNCTCLFQGQVYIRVTCTSVGNNLDEIAQELPRSTTHL